MQTVFTLILLVTIQSYLALAGRHFQVCPAEGRSAQTSQVSRLQVLHSICLRQALDAAHADDIIHRILKM